MKASDLIGSEVHDSTGKKLGHCFDIEAKKIGSGWRKGLELSSLLTGPFAMMQRLGYGRREMPGPAGHRLLGGRMDGYRIRWDQVDKIEHRLLRLNCNVEELEKL